MDKQENCKQIEGFQDYMINDQGRVWSQKRNIFLTPQKNPEGYLFVRLHNNGEVTQRFIHRLIAEAFLPNPNGYPEVNHKNEDKSDNRVSNLQWVSCQFNSEYSNACYYVLYDENDKRIEIFNIDKFARENELDKQNLYSVAVGRRKSHYGYTKEAGTKLNKKGSVRLISPSGETLTFNTQAEAADYIGCGRPNISYLLNGRLKSIKGWRLYPIEGIFAFT